MGVFVPDNDREAVRDRVEVGVGISDGVTVGVGMVKGMGGDKSPVPVAQ